MSYRIVSMVAAAAGAACLTVASPASAAGKMKAVAIDSETVLPSLENVTNGTCEPLFRPLLAAKNFRSRKTGTAFGGTPEVGLRVEEIPSREAEL